MPDLTTSYMGLKMRSPIVVAACTISSRIDAVQRAEEADAGALVVRSLFEEQLMLERFHMEEDLAVGAGNSPEAMSYFPELEHGDAQEHLLWIEKLRAAVEMPLIASLNAATPGSWSEYARQLEGAGANGIELNVYSVASDARRSGADIEKELYEVYESVAAQVKIPVSVKLGQFYTSFANVATELDKRKAAGLVMFNRFLQPDIDPDRETMRSDMPLSSAEEMRVPLRWIGLLHGRVKADLALNTGVQSGKDVVKALLGGATAVQVASAVLKNGAPYISTMLRTVERWMNERDYQSIDDFRGKLSQKTVEDPMAFERAQYVGLILSKGRNGARF